MHTNYKSHFIFVSLGAHMVKNGKKHQNSKSCKTLHTNLIDTEQNVDVKSIFLLFYKYIFSLVTKNMCCQFSSQLFLFLFYSTLLANVSCFKSTNFF